MGEDILGCRLKELRKEKGLSLHEVSVRTGVDRSVIGRIEKGLINSNIYTVLWLAEFYEVSLDWLLGRTSKKSL